MRALGAEVVLQGRDFDEAREWVEHTAEAEGYRYVHSANEPLLIAGVGTASLEVLEELPEVDAILVPIGAGSGACGHCLAAKAISRDAISSCKLFPFNSTCKPCERICVFCSR